MKFLCLAVLTIAATATAAPRRQPLRVRREEAKAEEAKGEEADEKFYGRPQPPQLTANIGGPGAGAPVFSHTTLVHHQTNLQGIQGPLPAGGILPVNGLPGGFGNSGVAGGFGGASAYNQLGYQPGSGYGGANVEFANVGPLGRPALSYQAQGINIQLREKEKGANKDGVSFGESR